MRNKVTIYNNTNFTDEEISNFPVIGKTINNWRQREIEIRTHPTDGTKVITIGTTFNGNMIVIADEDRTGYTTALEYIARGKVYVSQ
jgi:hypothetical protein